MFLMIEDAYLSEAKLALLARYLQGKPETSSETRAKVPLRSPEHVVPLSLYQEDLWFCEQTASEAPPFFNESITIHRRGALDVLTLERTLVEMFRRHEAWRTTIDVLQDRPIQVINPAPQQIFLQMLDLRALPANLREGAAQQAGEQQAATLFSLKDGPLVRVKVARLGDEDYRLFFTMHQIVVDGVSVYNVLPFELATIYKAFSQGEPTPLPELTVQLGDFAIWHRHWILREAPRQLAYRRK